MAQERGRPPGPPVTDRRSIQGPGDRLPCQAAKEVWSESMLMRRSQSSILDTEGSVSPRKGPEGLLRVCQKTLLRGRAGPKREHPPTGVGGHQKMPHWFCSLSAGGRYGLQTPCWAGWCFSDDCLQLFKTARHTRAVLRDIQIGDAL